MSAFTKYLIEKFESTFNVNSTVADLVEELFRNYGITDIDMDETENGNPWDEEAEPDYTVNFTLPSQDISLDDIIKDFLPYFNIKKEPYSPNNNKNFNMTINKK